MEGNPARKKQEPELDRRDFLKTGALLGAGALGYELLGSSDDEKDATTPERAPDLEIDFAGEYPELVGKPAYGLARAFLGIEGQIPERATINFPDAFESMWAQKVEYCRHYAQARNYSPAATHALLTEVSNFGFHKSREYRRLFLKGPEAIQVPQVPQNSDIKHPYFTKLLIEMNKIEKSVIAGLDWKELGRAYRFSSEGVDALRYFGERADARSLMGYSMTEIMPYSGKEGSKNNIALNDLVLRYGGVKGELDNPSLYDIWYESRGLFQFTRFAIDSHIANPHDPLSLNHLLPKELQIPGHVRDFATLKDHTTAALLFGIRNLAVGMENLDARGIERIAAMDGADFASLLAAHHNEPRDAKVAMREWIASPASAPYYTFIPKEAPVHDYSERSYYNYHAIDEHFQEIDI